MFWGVPAKIPCYISRMAKKAKELDLSDCITFQSLSMRQQRFVLHYLKLGNATKAAIKSGYSKKSAGAISGENLQKPAISAAITEVKRKLFQPLIADAQELREYWTHILRGDIGKIAQWNDGGLSFNSTSENMPQPTRRLIKKITVKEKTSPKGDFTEVQTSVELHDPLKASELLARDLGMLKEKVEHSGPDGGPIPTKLEIEFIDDEN